MSCLGERQAEVARAYELLERLGTHELSSLILKKHPEVVQTVSRVINTYLPHNVDFLYYTM